MTDTFHCSLFTFKHPDRAEADRFFNYPFPAIEEALCNAVYHRSYEIREPVEVRILPDRITISSFPGPDRSIRKKDMLEFRFLSRRYRNRRVGEFLKELEMTEGRGTGIPKMLRAIQANGSPMPVFHTDDDRTYFLVELSIHPVFAKVLKQKALKQVTPQVTPQVIDLLNALQGEMARSQLQERLGLRDRFHFRDAYLLPALEHGLIEMTIPDKPRSSKQKYRLTAKGKKKVKSEKLRMKS